MEATYNPEVRQLRLEFGSTEEITTFVESARRESGFLVTLSASLRLHDSVAVELVSGDDSSTVQARVAQVFDKGFGRHGTAFLVDDWSAVGHRPATDGLAAAAEPTASVPKQPADPAAAAESTETSGQDNGEMRGVSPIHAIKKMNPRQRAMLAIKASRTQRHILLRDSSPQVLQNLLANPHIDSEEVLQIARSSHVVAPVLQRIATDARWSGNHEILGAIARHPKTPSVFAARLMPSLRTSDLRMMAKMSTGPKEMTRKAALREYMRRTGQRI